MYAFQIDPEYIPQTRPDRIKDLCWMARDILASYMDEGADLDDEETNQELPELYCEGGEDGLTIHDTPLVPISAKRHISLTNMPYILDAKGTLVPWTEPGYVGLSSEPIAIDRVNRVMGAASGCNQLIFRLPAPQGAPAAIFEGYTLDRREITTRFPRKLQRIERLLICARTSLRALVEVNPDEYATMYHSKVPRVRTWDLLEGGFQELLGG